MQTFVSILLLATLVLGFGEALAYDRAIEGSDNVKNKLYPRQKRFELSAPNGGMILNQSYVETLLLNAGFVYHLSEEWGFGLDVSLASNSDKAERYCIENFYNDPGKQLASPCGGREALDDLGDRDGADGRLANYGPAYVPIREIQNIFTLNAVWVPVYGKQLVLLSSTSYFDLFFELGGALVTSQYYEKQEILRNGNASRGTFKSDGTQPEPPIGAEPDEADSYDVDGRPEPISQSNIALNVGIGQKFHFGDKFHLKMYLRNLTLLGTPSTFENLFVLFGGFGMRF